MKSDGAGAREDYLQSLLRINEAQVQMICRSIQKERHEVYLDRILEIQSEILSSKSSHVSTLIKPSVTFNILSGGTSVASHPQSNKTGMDFENFEMMVLMDQRYGHYGWYTDKDISKLLDFFYGVNPSVRIFPPLEILADAGETLQKSLVDNQAQEKLQSENGFSLADKLIVPINLGNQHWAALYINFNTDDRDHPNIVYIDPLGYPISQELINVLTHVYHVTPADIVTSSFKMQHDDFNCGPWVIAIFQFLIERNNELPNEDFDIHSQREMYEKILENTLDVSNDLIDDDFKTPNKQFGLVYADKVSIHDSNAEDELVQNIFPSLATLQIANKSPSILTPSPQFSQSSSSNQEVKISTQHLSNAGLFSTPILMPQSEPAFPVASVPSNLMNTNFSELLQWFNTPDEPPTTSFLSDLSAENTINEQTKMRKNYI